MQDYVILRTLPFSEDRDIHYLLKTFNVHNMQHYNALHVCNTAAYVTHAALQRITHM